VVLEQV
jgi:hypothetical protein